jgi:putative MATE family efflux protein
VADESVPTDAFPPDDAAATGDETQTAEAAGREGERDQSVSQPAESDGSGSSGGTDSTNTSAGGGPPGDGDPPSGDGPPGDDDPDESITEGSLIRPLYQLAWPIVVIQLLQVTYNIVDTLYLGRLSADAVGALSLAFPLIFLLIAVAGGFTSAGAILVAQFTGAKGDRSAGLVAGQTVMVVGVLSVVLGAFGYFYTGPALDLLPSDAETAAEVVPLAADYMEVIFLGLPLMFGFFVFTALMRGYGDTRTPMFIMVVSVAANILLDPFFIFGFENNPLFTWLGLGGLEASLHAATGFSGIGIEGAALATILSRGIATGIGMFLLFGTGIGPAVQLHHLKPDFGFIEDIIRLGTPTMIEQSTSALAMVTLTAIVVTFSPPVVAAYGLGNRIISVVFLPAMGVGRAIDTMVGQNLGAERADRAERSVWLAISTVTGVMLLVGVIAVTFAEPIVSVFLGEVENAPATIAHGVEYLRVRSVEFAFIGVTQVMLGAFRGAGNTKTAMFISIITLWVGRVGTMSLLIFGLGWGASGIWVGMAIGNIVGAILGVLWFLRGTWKERYIEEEQIESVVGEQISGGDD